MPPVSNADFSRRAKSRARSDGATPTRAPKAGGGTPRSQLHTLAERGDVEGLERLLEAGGSDVNSSDRLGCTPLHRAACAGRVKAVEVRRSQTRPRRTHRHFRARILQARAAQSNATRTTA